MAIKKCDDIVEQEGATEGATEESSESSRVLPDSGEVNINTESQNLADKAMEALAQATPETVQAALQDEEIQAALQATLDKYKKKQNAYLGKIITAVESPLYATISEPLLFNAIFGNGSITSTRPANISDTLRAEYRSFYSLDSNEQLAFFNNENIEKYGPAPIKITPTSPPIEITTYESGGDEAITQKDCSFFNKYQQAFAIESVNFIDNSEPSDTIKLGTAWEVLMLGGTDSYTGLSRPSAIVDTTQTYTDHYVKINSLFNDEEMERFSNAINNPAYGKVKPIYNFFVKSYEDYIASENISEYQLQNQFSNITRDGSQLQQQLHDLGMDYRYVSNVVALKDQQGYDITEKFQNIGIPKSSVPAVKQVTDTDDLYSLLNDIEFSTEATGPFMIAAAETGMTDDLFKHVMDQSIIYPGNIVSTAASNSLNFTLSTEIVTYNNDNTLINTEVGAQNVALVDLSCWLGAYFSSNSVNTINPNFSSLAILLGVDPNTAETSDDCSAFLKTLKSLLLSGKISQIVNERFRTFEEMLAGEEAYNETIMYEIVRTGGTSPQRVFVANAEELDIMKYVDTQVKYNTEYTYQIYAHQLIVGTKYSYYNFNYEPMDSSFQQGDSYKTLCGVTFEPSLQIARLPIFTQEVKILDSAPIFPDINIVPFKGVANRVLINLNGNMGSYELDPIIITDADADFVKSYRANRGLSSSQPILYESDDPVSEFEVYRSMEPPKSYSDFGNKLLTKVSSDVATSVSFVDDVSPNTKYYYTFRSIDVHGNRSNPTDIYVIELVEYDGMIFFNQSIYEFGNIKYNNVKTTKSFKRYFQINPNFIQSMIDYEKTFPNGDASSAFSATSVSVGRADTSVWDKRFKVRITSKNSGKKFDINFTCKTEFIKNSDNAPLATPGPIAAIAQTGYDQTTTEGVITESTESTATSVLEQIGAVADLTRDNVVPSDKEVGDIRTRVSSDMTQSGVQQEKAGPVASAAQDEGIDSDNLKQIQKQLNPYGL